ncbi:MAG: DNA-directed RNA polymerase subunit L [Candidatus Hadarchaeales archaeon]
MEIEVVEKKGDTLRIRIEGEGHTLCNLLKSELVRSDVTEAAAYRIDHPLTEPPEFYLKTSGKSPKSVMAGAAKRIAEESAEFAEIFQKAIKKKQQ